MFKPLIELSDQELLYYAACIRLNQYKYNYGRQANASLKFLEIPSPKDIPAWVKSYSIPSMKTYLNRASKDDVPFNPIKWKNLAWSNCLISIRAHFILKEHIQRGTLL